MIDALEELEQTVGMALTTISPRVIALISFATSRPTSCMARR
jgi:hypothetical protein